MPHKHADLDEPSSEGATFIVKDERAALRMKREETRETEAKYKAIVARENAAAKLELAKIRLRQSASEKARTNIALTTPLLLVLLIGGFIIMLGTGAIQDEHVSVASALLTLVAGSLMQNLRSIVSEGAAEASDANGKGNEEFPKTSSPKSKS